MEFYEKETIPETHIALLRRVMPSIILYDIVGVSPFRGPAGNIAELTKQFLAQKEIE